jgi:Ca-activated chloride channel homolog
MRLPRPIKNSLLLFPLVFAAQKVCAQLAPADDFFNSGAQFYISNNIPAAKERVESGLQIYPDDVKLKKLEELLKQQQQSQSSQSKQNQQQNQQQQSSQQNSQEQKNQNGQKQNPADQKKDEQQKSSEQKSNDDKNQNGENQAASGQMTPEEAKRLLDAQKGDEQVLQLKPQGKPENQNKTVKDW